jgi:undecaprenyl-diphosphatase
MKRLLTSCFGLGYLPVAPGTWGSLPAVLVFMLLGALQLSSFVICISMLVIALVFSVICVLFTPYVSVKVGTKDPSEIVADEMAGQSVCFAIAAFFIPSVCIAGIAGFALFRIFDIFKPWPVRKLESLPNGWGVLLDDIAAGVYAGILFIFFQQAGVFNIFSGGLCTNQEGINVISAVLLGAVQGITEFLPVSSSGHLVLLETIFDYNPENPEMLIFDLATHIGTLFAIFVVFAKTFSEFFKNLLKYRQYGNRPVEIYRRSPSVHILVLAILATFVTGVVGIVFKEIFQNARGDIITVGFMWVITGTLLLITDYRKKTRVGLREFGITAAIIVGLAQAAAIMPGISRSGATICAAILIGLHRRWSVEFSFALAIPAIAGAGFVQLISDFDKISSGGVGWDVLFFGSLAAFFVGVICLKLLIKVSRGANLKYFAFYCWMLAIGVFVVVLSS